MPNVEFPNLETILLAAPRSFCAGVERAVEIVQRALERFPKPIYVRKEIVHNRTVVDELARRGAVFVQSLEEAPDGSVLIFSAHGVSPAVREAANRKRLHVIDATCPLVTKVHREVGRFALEGLPTVLIGHAGHEEVEGTLGQAPNQIHLIQRAEDVAQLPFAPDAEVRYATQTTLSVDDTAEIVAALRARFPRTAGPRKDDICYATQNRQNAVKTLAADAQVVLVLGAANSSNSKRLMEVAQRAGASAFLIPTAEALEPEMAAQARVVGVTAGASSPEGLVNALIDRLRGGRPLAVREVREAYEDIHFALPPEIA